MNKGIVFSGIAILSLALVGVVQAAKLDAPGLERELNLPVQATNADIISLGSSVDPVSGKTVEGYAIFHHREGHNGGPGGGGNDNGGDTTSSCFAYLDKFAKWKNVEPYVVNPTNTSGLDPAYIEETIAGSIADWEEASGGADILGNQTGSALDVDGADSESPDGKNEVMFGDISSDGAIAVTIVWGIFGGPPQGRELVEWDQVYDEVDYVWSSTGEAEKMNFHNIAAHELGHAVGMGHPDNTCTEETMYAYASSGETKKQDLNTGDITGVDKLY